MSVNHRPPAPDTPLTDTLRATVAEAQSLPVHDAANFLHISPTTLLAWEQQFGFPASVGSDHPATYRITELLALQDALSDALSITSAIESARHESFNPRGGYGRPADRVHQGDGGDWNDPRPDQRPARASPRLSRQRDVVPRGGASAS